METGYYYLQARYYNPSIGRFISADPVLDTNSAVGLNLYAYCANDPVNRSDAAGTFWEEIWEEFVQTIQQSAGYFAAAALVSQADTVAIGPADVVSAGLLVVGVICCATSAICTIATTAPPQDVILQRPKSIARAKTREKEDVIPAPRPQSITYYHATTIENAQMILSTRTMVGSAWEGHYICMEKKTE